MNTNQPIGISEQEIPRNIIQDCPICLCIPASILFILRCHDSGIAETQNTLVKKANLCTINQMNFEKATQLTIPNFKIQCKGFSLEGNSNDRTIQFANWKNHIIKNLNHKNPIACCFKNHDGNYHCKVIFQYDKDSFKIFNPGTCDTSGSVILVKKNYEISCPYCSTHKFVNGYYSTIETYTFQDAFEDLKIDKLQMEVLSVSKS